MKELEESNAMTAVSIICESLRLYTLVLNQKNSNIAKCEDSLAKCYASAGKIILTQIIFNRFYSKNILTTFFNTTQKVLSIFMLCNLRKL